MGWITDFNRDMDIIVIGGHRIKVVVDRSLKPSEIKFVNPYDEKSITFTNIKPHDEKPKED